MFQSLEVERSGWLPTAAQKQHALLPFRPYGRSGIGCIVGQNNGKLLSQANLAIGQMMQAYMDGDAGTAKMVDRWIGPDSSVGSDDAQGISRCIGLMSEHHRRNLHRG